jgi:hypothetical protein
MKLFPIVACMFA